VFSFGVLVLTTKQLSYQQRSHRLWPGYY
jgi:hypothetical protein